MITRAGKVKLAGVILGILVVSGLAYVSLLGENNKAAKIVFQYLDNISKKQYDFNAQYCSGEYLELFDTVNDAVTHQFSLELALLKHFGIGEENRYTVEVKRDSFWLPFSGNDTVCVSVRYSPNGSGEGFCNLFSVNRKEFVSRLFQLRRENGSWKIDRLELESGGLAAAYHETRQEMSSSRYIVQHEHGVTILENILDFSQLTSMQKRMITFDLNKVISLLNAGP